MNKRQLGETYEQKTKCYLEEQGMSVRSMNYRCKFGEVDLIVIDNGDLVFVEVKYRKNKAFGYPEESVTYIKKRNIIKTAKWYVYKKGLHHMNIRFDVAAWHEGKLIYYKGAFEDE